MSVWYVHLESGNDSLDGLSWATAKLTPKSIPTASIMPGDEVRVAKSADPVQIGTATWTDGSTTVTLSASQPSLTTSHLVSRSGDVYWGHHPWHTISSIVGTTVTLARKYRGPSGTAPIFLRMPCRPTPGAYVLVGFGATGGTAINGTAGQFINISGGWNTSTGLRDGQTFIDGQTKQVIGIRVMGAYLNVSRFSLARCGDMALAGYISPQGTIELDNVLESSSIGYVYGSGNAGQHGTFRANVICGHPTHGVHIHTSWNNTIEVGRILDNGVGISQNNDYPWQQGNIIRIGESAYNAGGFGGSWATFNFVDQHDITIDALHDNGYGIRMEPTGTNVWRIGRAWNNGTDLDLSYLATEADDGLGGSIPIDTTVYQGDAWRQSLVGCLLESTTPIYNPFLLQVPASGVTRKLHLAAKTATTGLDGGDFVQLGPSQSVSWRAVGDGRSAALTVPASSVLGGELELRVNGVLAQTLLVPSGGLPVDLAATVVVPSGAPVTVTLLEANGSDTIVVGPIGLAPASADVAQPASFGASFAASDAYLVARNPMLARSWLAGPAELLDSPLDRADLRQSIVQSSSATFAAAWTATEALAASLGFQSMPAFVAAWSAARAQAHALGFTSLSAYVVSVQEGRSQAHGFGFTSGSAFVAAWARTTALAEQMGFASVSAFVAHWDEVSEYRPTFAFLSDATWLATFPDLFRVSAAYGIASTAALTANWLADQTDALTFSQVSSAEWWDDMAGGLALRWSVGLALDNSYLPGSPQIGELASVLKAKSVRFGLEAEWVRLGLKAREVRPGIVHGRSPFGYPPPTDATFPFYFPFILR